MEFIAFLVVVGFILSILISYRQKNKSRCTACIEATVVDLEYREDRDRKNDKPVFTYNPIFEYEWNGWTRKLQGNVFSSKHNFEIGQKVQLYINPNDPSEFIYKDAKNDPLIGMAITTFMAIGIIIIFYYLGSRF